jgi:hypothetical protein
MHKLILASAFMFFLTVSGPAYSAWGATISTAGIKSDDLLSRSAVHRDGNNLD